jgi:hypothetical protein
MSSTYRGKPSILTPFLIEMKMRMVIIKCRSSRFYIRLGDMPMSRVSSSAIARP